MPLIMIIIDCFDELKIHWNFFFSFLLVIENFTDFPIQTAQIEMDIKSEVIVAAKIQRSLVLN